MVFEVQGRRFTITFENGGVRCTPHDPADAVLCDVVTLGWQLGPERLMDAVRAGRGLGFIDVAGFTYFEEAAAEFPEGASPSSVMVDFYERSQVLDRSEFEAFVGTFAVRATQSS